MNEDNWFDVSREGLRAQMSARPKYHILFDLIQNVWDEISSGATICRITFGHVGRNRCRLIVEDNSPIGVRNPTDIWTMFAPSYKKDNPTQRGCFNIGEKLGLAWCYEATIATTTASVTFLPNGKKKVNRHRKRKEGTVVEFELTFSKDDFDEVESMVDMLLVPPEIETIYNDRKLEPRIPLKIAEGVMLKTVQGDGLTPTKRKTDIHVHEPREGETPYLYEMGIPVVPCDLPWHVDIQQRLQQNWNRDNVHASLLEKVGVAVMNEAFDKIETPEQANELWARKATADPDCEKDAFNHSMDLRFSKKRVAYDPSDKEANSKAVAKGYRVVHGGNMSGGEWDNAKTYGSVKPAGQVFPTPHVYSDDPDAEMEEVVPCKDWPLKVKYAARHAQMLAKELMGVTISVKVVRWGPAVGFRACYGHRQLTMDIDKCFNRIVDKPTVKYHSLVIHEFGHQDDDDNHLDDTYYKALSDLGAKLGDLCLNKPELFSADHFTRPFDEE